MLDFIEIAYKRIPNKGITEIYPKFMLRPNTKDLMTRGNDFYAIWDEEHKLWSTKESTALQLIDRELDEYAKNNASKFEDTSVRVLHMDDTENKMIDRWLRYVQRQMRETYHPLDEKIIFSNTETEKEDYASKKLPYSLQQMPIPAYDELISVLYSPEERAKIEWAIGSIVSGDSKTIQKFIVMYGAAGTGKSTILNIIQDLFSGYYCVFDAKALGSANNDFALESFKTNPLVAIQHDGDLSRIEDNTRLNSVVSHEVMTVNEKFKSTYASRFNCFLFMGTNKPVRITDAKSGIIRRLIDVSPTGQKFAPTKYKRLISQIKYELGGIAQHCLDVYKSNPGAYDNYIPIAMLGASNDFYNFIEDSSDVFEHEGCTTLKAAWEMYKEYCNYAKVPYPYSQRVFKEELKNYFGEFRERDTLEDGTRVRNLYSNFMFDKFKVITTKSVDSKDQPFELNCSVSILDQVLADCPAQYASANDTPQKKWADVTTTLKDISTDQVHYVKLPDNHHIVIDFDLKDDSGNKSYILNAAEASKWPRTYAELSKGGEGIHLHYIYTGDTSKLARLYSPGIEVKVFNGNSSLRRRLSRCNDIQIATISSGLPLVKEEKVVDYEGLKNEKALRTFVTRNMKKQYHPGTKPSIDFIKSELDKAYESGMSYDISDMLPAIIAFGAASTNHSDYCLDLINEMHFKSKDHENEAKGNVENYKSDDIIFFDVEVFPNLFVIVWKRAGNDPVKMINPSPTEVESLLKFKLVGFNNRKYDNHILYARLMGYSNEQLFALSQKIVNNDRNALFGEAYNLSYADIYDFSSKKQSLKKFEIELGIHHQELGFKWDEPVPENKWEMVADYCINDVLATEAVFNARKQDFVARQVLADISGLTVNDTTRMHTTKIIFGSERHPKLNYTKLDTLFPGYTYEGGKSSYRGEDPGEGGYVYANPGIYHNVALLDIASMHPSSIIALDLFGDYTKNFKDILSARIAIKHHDYDLARSLLNGAFVPYLTDEDQGKALAAALKIVINSVYGYTTATFDNPFKDIRNADNIVAKRGSLFMINLKHEVQDRGYTVAHIKTDSIKIPNADRDIISFVQDYGKQWGYNFEFEAVYDRMCLVNQSVYIAKYADPDKCRELFNYVPSENAEECMKAAEKGWAGPWTATGAQFQQPVVFKTLFTKEALTFEDKCEAKETKAGNLYLDLNEGLPEDNHRYHFVGRIGQFCPIKPGQGGGELFREQNDKYYAAPGTKGYRWLESETVKLNDMENDIDMNYYEAEVKEAIDSINQFGDFEQFVN